MQTVEERKSNLFSLLTCCTAAGYILDIRGIFVIQQMSSVCPIKISEAKLLLKSNLSTDTSEITESKKNANSSLKLNPTHDGMNVRTVQYIQWKMKNTNNHAE